MGVQPGAFAQAEPARKISVEIDPFNFFIGRRRRLNRSVSLVVRSSICRTRCLKEAGSKTRTGARAALDSARINKVRVAENIDGRLINSNYLSKI
jgi:hypothetical protein